MSKKQATDEMIKKLYSEYKLDKDTDVFINNHYRIITRMGIDKIRSAAGITIQYEVEREWRDEYTKKTWSNKTKNYVEKTISAGHHFFIKAIGTMGTGYVETYASATPENNDNPFALEMAEKRAMSRVVLKLAGLYELGYYGIDEVQQIDADKDQELYEYLLGGGDPQAAGMTKQEAVDFLKKYNGRN